MSKCICLEESVMNKDNCPQSFGLVCVDDRDSGRLEVYGAHGGFRRRSLVSLGENSPLTVIERHFRGGNLVCFAPISNDSLRKE